ncbi:MAG: LptA/OstA family protein [Candidatus Wallbacteria bacterium]
MAAVICILGITAVGNFAAVSEKDISKVSGKIETKKQPIEISGDLLEMEPDGTYVVSGNVRVVQNKRILTCARGTYNEKTGITQALMNVNIFDPNFKMNCQRVDSHTKENFSVFSGNVNIEGDRFFAYADKALYNEKEEKVTLVGNPVSKSKDKTPNEVRGERIIYYLKNDRVEVIGNVTASLNPKENDPKGSPTHITGNKLEMLPDGRYQVLDSLRVIKKDMILYADRGIYDETSEVTEAFGNVKIENNQYTLTAGYVKNISKEDRTFANIKPKLVQIVAKKDNKKQQSDAGDTGAKNDGAEETESVFTDDENEPADNSKTNLGRGISKNVKDGNKTNGKEPGGDKKKSKDNKKVANKDKIILEANEIESYAGNTHVVARGKVKMVQFPYIDENQDTSDIEITSTVNSEIIDIFTEEGKMIAKENVTMTTKDITAFGDTATFYDKAGKLEIEGNARALQKRGKGNEDNDVVGAKITYYTQTDRIIVDKPQIKFFQTNKEEEKLPEIEAETKGVKLNKRKTDKTAEVTLKTGEVQLPAVDKTASTSGSALTGSGSASSTGGTGSNTGNNQTTVTPGTGQQTNENKNPPGGNPPPGRNNDGRKNDGTDSLQKQQPQRSPKVKLTINPASGKVKVKNNNSAVDNSL